MGRQPPQVQKRTRVLLSCAPCRSSKLKCDRATPCGQCLRKGKPDVCLYAPRPEKNHRPAKSMAARLKRLEGMVRKIIEPDGSGLPGSSDETVPEPTAGRVIIRGHTGASYIGGTHFMAILEDIEGLKSYFENSSEDGDETSDPYENTQPGELMMFSRGVPRNKSELLSLLPAKPIVDHTIHVPTFLKEYRKYSKNLDAAPLHWIALLYMILALGVFFSMFQAPHELENDSPVPAADRFKQLRGAAGWALVWGKYSQPGPHTLQAFLLYVEGEFVTNRDNQMNSYLLSSILIRLMLKMGLHRDPSRLPNITPYDGEIRKRLWNVAMQIDLLVSFNTDTSLPTNLADSDFDETTEELPPARPNSDYTPLTYPIYKAGIARVFGLVVRQAHSLTAPTYTEVTKIDTQLEEVWSSVPDFMRAKPVEESVMDPAILVIQRHGLASLYQKSRCVLHRRYLVEAVQKRELDYSRRVCLDAALALLEYQNMICESCKPGGMLNSGGWFVAALAANDFLLGGMVVAFVLETDKFWEVGSDCNWIARGPQLPTRSELLRRLQRSHTVWRYMAGHLLESKKAEMVVRTVLRRIETQLGVRAPESQPSSTRTNGNGETVSMANLAIDGSGSSTTSNNDEPPIESLAGFGGVGPNTNATIDGIDQIGSGVPWMTQDGYDWVSSFRQFPNPLPP
ncbi:hypothetical protein GGS23DRAFT_604022 [Durotheca rogersii]|uniref:uncharacterized protein n=1 Tax=Durotheca rogersii TaxID=419775 RepID=UPI00221F055D|nr:uncharacterized protein GGS23DRAFT_604022 [Durotheca rogersii]KAI5865521.1 hypothetical protein GGS23DRAFT_604022 [Durotheca rogersii]